MNGIAACLTRSAERIAYHTAPAMLTASPVAFHGSKIKSPNAKAPTMVMMAFFRLPAGEDKEQVWGKHDSGGHGAGLDTACSG